MTGEQELAELLEAYGEGRLTPAQDARLAALAEERPEVLEQLQMMGWLGQVGVTEEQMVRSVLQHQEAASQDSACVAVVRRRRDRRQASRPRRRFGTQLLLVLLIVAAGLGVTWWQAANPPPLRWQSDGRKVLGMWPGSHLARTAPTPLVGLWRDGSRLEVSPKVTFEWLDQPGKQLRLTEGSLTITAVKQPVPLTIQTPEAIVTVVGTAFTVRRSADTTWCSVTAGQVRVAAPDGRHAVDVMAGESVRFDARQAWRVLAAGWEERREDADVAVQIDGDRVAVSATDTVRYDQRPLAIADQQFSLDQPVAISGRLEQGPVDGVPYVEWGRVDRVDGKRRKMNIRLLLPRTGPVLEERGSRDQRFRVLGQVAAPIESSHDFRMVLSREQISAWVDGTLVFAGSYDWQPVDSIGLGLRAEHIAGPGVCATFTNLRIEQQIPP